MSLVSVKKFFEFRPHLPFRFEVEIFTANDSLTATLKYAVQSVKITGVDCDTSKAATFFGNGYKTIPIFNVATRQITIAFEETDEMRITRFIDELVNAQRWGLPNVVGIRVSEFNTNFNRRVSDRYFKCVLSTYDEPAFSRTGGPGIVSISVTFNIMSEVPWSQHVADNHDVGKMKVQAEDSGITEILDAVIEQTNTQRTIIGDDSWIKEFRDALEAGRDKEHAENPSNEPGGVVGGAEIPAKKPKQAKDSEGKGVASAWNAFRYNAQHKNDKGAQKLRNLMNNENSWINMAFKQEKSIGEQKKVLKQTLGLTDSDFADPATLMEAMQRAEKKAGGNGTVWGSVYACSAATGWAYMMTTQDDNYVMPQDMMTKGGKATGDYMAVIETTHPELFETAVSKTFTSQAEAEKWITENAGRNANVSMATKGRGHRAVAQGGGIVSSDHQQGKNDAIPNCYGNNVSVTIRKFKGKKRTA